MKGEKLTLQHDYHVLGTLNFMINVRKWVSLTGPLVS